MDTVHKESETIAPALRSVDATDLSAMRHWRRDRTLRNLTHGFRYPSNDVMERKWFETKVVHGAPQHAVFAIQSGEGTPLGIAQLSPIDPIHRHAKLGIYLAEAGARGQGLGRRVLDELLVFGFQDLTLHKVFLEVSTSNTAAIKLYKAAGFVVEGCMREHFAIDGKLVDVSIMSLFATEHITQSSESPSS